MTIFQKLKSKEVKSEDVYVDSSNVPFDEIDSDEKKYFEKYSTGIAYNLGKLSAQDTIMTTNGRILVFSSKGCDYHKFRVQNFKSLEENFLDAFPTCKSEIEEFISFLRKEELNIVAEYQHDGMGISCWTNFYLVL